MKVVFADGRLFVGRLVGDTIKSPVLVIGSAASLNAALHGDFEEYEVVRVDVELHGSYVAIDVYSDFKMPAEVVQN